MPPTFPALTVEVDEGSMLGIGATGGIPAGAGGSAVTVTVAGGCVAGRGDDGEGPGLLGLLVGPGFFAGAAVTVTVPVAMACAGIGGFVAATAEAVRLTDAAPLDGVAIWAWRMNDDGVTSVPSGPSWHQVAPSPLGHKPVNVALPADAASVTDTNGTGPFCAWTRTVNRAGLPAVTLDSAG
jgi:hypothetical protein